MALEVEQRLDDAHVALVDGDVQRRLPPLVPGVLSGGKIANFSFWGGNSIDSGHFWATFRATFWSAFEAIFGPIKLGMELQK